MKKLFAVLVVASIVAVGAFAVDTTTTTVAKMTATTVAKATTTTVAKATTTTVAAMSAAKVVTGKIVSFTADKTKKTEGTLVVADSAKKEISIVVPNKTVIVDAKKKAMTMKDLVAGKAVTVDYNDKDQATKITL